MPKEKSTWDKFKDGFKPMSSRADEQVRDARMEYGNKLSQDMQDTPEERARKLREGFMKRIGK